MMEISQTQKQHNPSLKQLLNQLQIFEIQIQKQKISGKVIVLLGDTKAGKTTLLYYLTGQQLKWIQDKKTKITKMQAAHVYHNALISETTSYPNIYSNVQQEWTIIDFPGFNDDRNLNKLLNSFILQKTFQKFQQVHFCLVIPNQLLFGIELIAYIAQFKKLIKNSFIQSSSGFSVILTKIQDGESVKQDFLSLLTEIKQQSQQIQQFIETILESGQDSVFLFANAQPQSQKGQQILKQILQTKKFLRFHNFSQIFHQKYFEAVFGEYKNQKFQSYMISIIQGMAHIIQSQLKLTIALFKHIFRNSLSKVQNKDPNLYLEGNLIFSLSQMILNNDQNLLVSIKDIVKSAKISDKYENQIAKILFQLNLAVNSLEEDDENQGIQIFGKTVLYLKILGQFQFYSESQNQTFQKLSNYLVINVSRSIENILQKIKKINIQNKRVMQTIYTFKEDCKKIFKQTHQNLVNWQKVSQYLKKSQVESSGLRQNDTQLLQRQPVQKTRRQEVQQQLQKLTTYIKVKQLQDIAKSLKNFQQLKNTSKNQKQKQDQTKSILSVLKSCVIQYSKAKKQSKAYREQTIFYDNLIKCRRVQNNQFLKFFLQNLITLLQIINEYNKWDLFKSILQQKICPTLAAFNLLQEAILFAMIIPNIQIIQKVMKKNYKVHKISKDFIQQKLIKFSISMKSKSILVKCFNQLNCNFIQDRFSSQGSNYQKNLNSLLAGLAQIEKPDIISQKKSKQLQVVNFDFRYLHNVSIKQIVCKVNLIQERNQKYKSLHQFKKKIASYQQKKQ